MAQLLTLFESRETGDSTFVEEIHSIIIQESQSLYDEIFSDTSIEVGKTLSKMERDTKKLTHNKVKRNKIVFRQVLFCPYRVYLFSLLFTAK